MSADFCDESRIDKIFSNKDHVLQNGCALQFSHEFPICGGVIVILDAYLFSNKKVWKASVLSLSFRLMVWICHVGFLSTLLKENWETEDSDS